MKRHYKAPALKYDMNGERIMPLWLVLGLFFSPVLFVWFTLFDKYSTKTRLMAFGWMAIYLVLVLYRLSQI